MVRERPRARVPFPPHYRASSSLGVSTPLARVLAGSSLLFDILLETSFEDLPAAKRDRILGGMAQVCLLTCLFYLVYARANHACSPNHERLLLLSCDRSLCACRSAKPSSLARSSKARSSDAAAQQRESQCQVAFAGTARARHRALRRCKITAANARANGIAPCSRRK